MCLELLGTLGQPGACAGGGHFPGTLESAQTSSPDSGQAADSFASIRSQSKSTWNFRHFRSDQAHAQGEAQSSKTFLALWNRPKLVLQTLGKLAIRFQAVHRKVNLPGTFGHFRSDQANVHVEARSSKSFLARWNRPKLVLQTLGKLAIRLQALDRKVNVPGTFEPLRSDQAHAQKAAQSSKSFLARWNRPKLVLQTLGKLAIRLQALDRKVNVPGTFGYFRSDQAHAQGEAQSCKSFLARWNRPKLVLQTLGKLAIRLQVLDCKVNLPGTFGTLGQTRRMCRGRPRVLKVSWHFGIGPN